MSIFENVFQIIPIQGDGNCLFRSISQFLFDTQDKHVQIREETVEFISKNWEEFKSFLVNSTDKQQYGSSMLKLGTYGTHIECMAISEIHKINVQIYLSKDKQEKKLFTPKQNSLCVSKNQYQRSIFLLFSGNPDSGHYDLLSPLKENYCLLCSKIFKNKNGLKIHNRKIHHDLDSQNLTKTFRDDVDSTDISTNHGNSQNFSRMQCNVCGNVYKGYKGLKQHLTMKHKLDTNELNGDSFGEIDINKIHDFLQLLKSSIPIVKRLPKGARICIAEELTSLVSKCTTENSPRTWINLFIFPYAVLKVPDKSKNKNLSLTTSMKNNLTIWRNNKTLSLNALFQFYEPKYLENKNNFKHVKKSRASYINRKIEGKISENDIRGAIRLLCSEDTLAESNESTLKKLEEKHPTDIQNQVFPDPPTLGSNQKIFVSVSEIQQAINSFKPGSAGGLDSLRPQHLKDLVGKELGTTSYNLLSSFSSLISHILNNSVEKSICQIFYGASLCALAKKDGIRPIAVGMCIRRLAAKVVCAKIKESLGTFLRPKQLGFGTKCGSEIAVHAIRRYLSYPHPSPKAILKIDFYNAFNMISRSTILSRVKEFIPEYFNFINQCYREHSFLSFNKNIILSQRGVQQGDPLGPALFCLAIYPIVDTLKSEINLWYLDDGTLAGDVNNVLDDFQYIISECSNIGLEINFKKCEISFLSEKTKSSDFSNFSDQFKNISVVDKNSFTLLGCVYSDHEIRKTIAQKILVFQTLTKNISLLDSHVAFFLLRHSFAVPRMTYLLRCAPCWKALDDLHEFDSVILKSVENITNCKINEISWLQCNLPVKMGGLGIRDTSTLCYPAFISSAYFVTNYTNSILPKYVSNSPDKILFEGLKKFQDLLGPSNIFKINPNDITQKLLDEKLCRTSLQKLLSTCDAPQDKARLLAFQQPESNAWLNALPSAALGNLMDDSSFRISVALRLGLPVCEVHTCTCGKNVDIHGLHGLSCIKSVGRSLRHGLLNDIIKRSLVSAGIPCILEPPGICREDGKRADGLTLVPWKAGKSLIWDATCRDTMAASYLDKTSKSSGEAARSGEMSKKSKYRELEGRYIFVPFSVESFGPWGNEAKKFVSEISNKIKHQKVHGFITQRISLAIQRGNAASVLGTIPADRGLDEFLYL